MPQLEENLWIEGGYYIDFDELEQLRIIGPNNELYMGLIDIPRHKIRLRDIIKEGDVSTRITGEFTTPSINLYYPAMDDIRTIRDLTSHPSGRYVSFLELRRTNPAESVPMYVRKTTKHKKVRLLFQRNYGESWYNTTWIFSEHVSVRAINRPYKGYKLSVKGGKKRIPFEIIAATNDFDSAPCTCRLLPAETLDWKHFGQNAKQIEKFWYRTQFEIDHLISWKKTSGDRFGTIFPRDWMETILLGEGDMQPETIDQVLSECLTHVDYKGRGWHEDVVGEYKYEHQLAGKDLYDRKMIDIEPLYLLCLPFTSPSFLRDKKSYVRLKRVARYITRKASKHTVIPFKRHAAQHRTPDNEHHKVGDWRDSAWAYKQIHDVLAPFSVNVSHYPLALKIIQSYAKSLGVDKTRLSGVVKKWSKVKKLYAYTDEQKCSCYALAIYDIQEGKNFSAKKMTVGHLDEAYLYALGEGTEAELCSFAKRLLSAKAFYTASGPTLITQKNSFGYTTAEYHGLVIWAKQAAFAVKAIAKHRKIAQEKSWKPSTKKLLDEALEKTCNSTLTAFITLNAVPELHYDKNGLPHFYTEQPEVRGSMSKVQLWSAMGYRTIVRAYHDYLTEKK